MSFELTSIGVVNTAALWRYQRPKNYISRSLFLVAFQLLDPLLKFNNLDLRPQNDDRERRHDNYQCIIHMLPFFVGG